MSRSTDNTINLGVKIDRLQTENIELGSAWNNAQKEIRILKNMNMSVDEIVRHSENKDKKIAELEEFKKSAEAWQRNTHLGAKKSIVEKKILEQQNSRYREKLEFIQDIQQWHRKEPDYEVLNIVNEALEE